MSASRTVIALIAVAVAIAAAVFSTLYFQKSGAVERLCIGNVPHEALFNTPTGDTAYVYSCVDKFTVGDTKCIPIMTLEEVEKGLDKVQGWFNDHQHLKSFESCFEYTQEAGVMVRNKRLITKQRNNYNRACDINCDAYSHMDSEL